jgi:Transglycosylase
MRLPGSRRTKIAVGVFLALLLAAVVGFGPLVRSKVAKEADRRGLVISVESVSPSWFAVELHGVTLRPEGVDAIDTKVDLVRVELSGSLSVDSVVATGVTVEAKSTPEQIQDAITAWRDRHPSSGGPSTHITPIHIEQLKAHWRPTPEATDDLSVTGASASRDADGWHFAAEEVDVQHADASLKVGSQSLDFDANRRLVSAHAAKVDLALTLHPEPEPPPPAITAPTPPPANKKDEPFTPLVTLPNLHVLRGRMQTLADLLGAHTSESANADIDALSLTITREKEALSLGPGKATFARNAKSIDLEFIAGQGATPFSVHASLPLGPDDVVASLSGGPVSLSLLGVHEGAMGVQHPDKAMLGGKGRVVLDAKGAALTFDGDTSLRGLSITQPKISAEPISGLELSMAARGMLDDQGTLRLDDADISMSALHIRGHGSLAQASDHFEGTMTVDVPAASCQSLLDSVPTALVPHLAGTRYRGTLAIHALTQFDSRKLDDLVLKYDVSDGCHTISVPRDLDKSRFSGTFEHEIVDKKGDPETITTGPGSESWADIDDISPFMQMAVLTTEDGSFYRHHGFNHNAIRASLIANLKAHKFVRGASTITMQLAKNLFLNRDKTLSRKFEEVILATYLEDTFSKQEMMELYLNLIEFGPDVYGVVQAADHYFGRKPAELNLAESLFLASLLPNPIELHKKLYEKGALPDWWMKRLQGLMQIAAKNGHITPNELAEGLSEQIVFHHEGDPPPVPRPVNTSRVDLRDDWDTPTPN